MDLRFQQYLPPFDYRVTAVVIFFCRTSIVNIISLLGLDKHLLAIGVTGIAYLFLLLSLIFYKKTFVWDGLFLIAATVVFFYYSIQKNPEAHAIYFSGEFEVFSRVFNLYSMIFSYYFIRILPSYEKIKKAFQNIAIVTFLGTFWNFSSGTAVGGGATYSMIYGYSMSLCAILFLWQFFDSKKQYGYLFLSLVCIGLAGLLGSRGALVGYGGYVILYFIFVDRPLVSMRKVWFAGICVIGFVVYESKPFLMALYRFTDKMGFTSRTLLMLAQGEIATNNGRTNINRDIHQGHSDQQQRGLDQMGLFEHKGAYGDRILTNGRFYAHNIFYELLLTFGKFFGMLIIGALTLLFVSAVYLIRKNKSFQNLLLALLAYTICRLMFSGSFWYEQFFGVILGLSVSIVSYRGIAFDFYTPKSQLPYQDPKQKRFYLTL